MKNKMYLWLIFFFVVTLVIYVSGVFQSVENWGLNHRFYMKHLFAETELESPIVIVGIDERSISQIGRWPWPREYHRDLLTELAKAGAIVVGVDLIFDLPSNPTADQALAEGLRSVRSVLPLTLDLEMYSGILGEEIKVNAINRPLPMFYQQASTGHINLIADQDGVIRRSFPTLDGVGSFALALARAYQPEKAYQTEPFLIHYAGPPMSFPVYSYQDVLDGRYPAEAFRGKIVLVGVLDPALGDQFVTPFARFGLMPGIEIHAHQLHTLLLDNALKPWSVGQGVLFLTLLALVAGLVAYRFSPVWKLVIYFAIGLLYYLYSHYTFIHDGIVLPYLPTAFLLVSNLVISILFAYWQSDAEHTRLFQTFHRYLAPQVLHQVMVRSEEVKLGGAQKMAAVLFIDIRGFTAYTHAHRPEEVVELLNQYLQLFADVIFAFEGTLDKYLGDGLMAVFGAPVEGEDDVERAFSAALEIRARVETRGLPLSVGMGLAYGPVISGNIGSEKRMDFTVIGNTVNTASRLEGLAGPGEIVMSAETAERLGQTAEAIREEVTIRGIEGMTVVYRIL